MFFVLNILLGPFHNFTAFNFQILYLKQKTYKTELSYV